MSSGVPVGRTEIVSSPAMRRVSRAGQSERWRIGRGRLIRGDAAIELRRLRAGAYPLIFADPPFNIGKVYGDSVAAADRRDPADYLAWCRQWLDQLVRLLSPGGSLFVYNLPRWNVHLAAHLEQSLTFRHWIAIDIKYSLPVPRRLYPAHYSLLYFIKGDRARTFNPPRQPMLTCRHCGMEVKDYGGHKDKLNPSGFTLSDVWSDLSPVRHKRFKAAYREGNRLPVKMMDRILDLASVPGDLVLDPFAGSGTTLVTAQLKGRRWTGIEIESVEPILERFRTLGPDRAILADLERSKNRLFTEEALALRNASGHKLGAYRLMLEHELDAHGGNGAEPVQSPIWSESPLADRGAPQVRRVKETDAEAAPRN